MVVRRSDAVLRPKAEVAKRPPAAKRSAKSNQQKKAEKLKADKAKGFKSMTFQAGATTVANLQALCVRYHFEDWRELVTRLIDSTHDNQLADVIPVPRHEFVPTEKMLSKLERLGVLMAAQADEVGE